MLAIADKTQAREHTLITLNKERNNESSNQQRP